MELLYISIALIMIGDAIAVIGLEVILIEIEKKMSGV